METSSSARTGVVTWAPVALALGLVAVATLVPTSPGTRAGGIAFWCLGCGDYALADAVANVALFVPLGWALARARFRLPLGVAVVLTTTLTVEGLQYGLVPGRDASAADILTNTVGGVAGMVLSRVVPWIAASGTRALRGATLYGVLVIAALGAGEAMQAVHLARVLRWTEGNTEGYVPFTGSLRAVQVGGARVAMHEWRVVPSREVVEVAVHVISGRPDTGLAQLVIAWMPSGSGWMWLEQRDRDLRVHLASASDHSGLRGHSVWLGASMPATAGEPLTVRLVVWPFRYRIVVETEAGEVVQEVRITPGDGWRLFSPFERSGERWASWFTAGWMAVLFGPLGYLASVRSRATAAVAAVGVGLSLVLLPIVTGCAWLRLSGWCGAIGGLLVGVARATRGGVGE